MNDPRIKSEVKRLIEENLKGTQQPRSKLVCIDPTLEPLQREIKRRLPEFATTIAACDSPDELDQWGALAEIRSLLESRGEHVQRDKLFEVTRVSGNPGDVAYRMAESLGRRIVPPARTMTWLCLDTIGCVYTILCFLTFSLLRIGIFFGLGLFLEPRSSSQWAINASAWFGWPILTGTLSPTVMNTFYLMVACGWLLLESALVIHIAETLRRQPINAAKLAQNCSWRLDSLSFAYLALTFGIGIGFLVRAWILSCMALYDWENATALQVVVIFVLIYATGIVFLAASEVCMLFVFEMTGNDPRS